MTVHVISVGDSVLDHLEDARCYVKDEGLADKIEDNEPWLLLKRADAHHSGEEASRWLASAFAPPDDPAHSAQAAIMLKDQAEAVSPELWSASLSAELSTFAQVPEVRYPLSRKDTAILICSDTVRGQLAGLWNAAVLAGGDLARVRYSSAPGEVPSDLRGHARFVRVPGLEAGTDAGFREAMRGLGALGRTLLDSGGIGADEPFRFHLSGGFKASVPYLIGLAEGLRSLDFERDIEAYVLHEFTMSSAIRLPLRRLRPGPVRRELDSFGNTGICDDRPEPGLLEGYAYDYDRDARKWRLTAFGDGLCELFGQSDEVLQ